MGEIRVVYWRRNSQAAAGVTNEVAISHLNRVQVVPLTTNVSRVYPSEAIVVVNGRPHKAMADQLSTVSKERIETFFGSLSEGDMESLDTIMRLHLGL